MSKLGHLFGLVVCVSMLIAPCHGLAQGVIRSVEFDGVNPGTSYGTTYYYENSFTFVPVLPSEYFVRAGGSHDGFPENRTAYLLFGLGTSLSGTRGGSRFGLYSVDLAEFSTLYSFPATIEFIGYRPDGKIVTTEFTTDGIIDGTGPLPDFQTFYFDSRFSDLVRFDLPGIGYGLDNLRFYHVIPEPGAIPLLALGAGIFCALRLRTKKSTAPQSLV
jgi:hypothetical protein